MMKPTLLLLLALSTSAFAAETSSTAKSSTPGTPRYTITIDDEMGRPVTYFVYGTSATASELLTHFSSDYDKVILLNGVDVSTQGALEKIEKTASAQIAREVEPFIRALKAYGNEVAPCNSDAMGFGFRVERTSGKEKAQAEADLLKKSAECQAIKKKHFSKLSRLGKLGYTDLKIFGVVPEPSTGSENDE